MLSQGPIPLFVHGVLDYVLGALLIAAPFLFGFSDVGAATTVSIVAGVLVILSGASTDGLRTSLVKVIPLGAHIMLDYLLGALFIAAPFLFGFSDESAPTVFFIVLGVLALLITLATRWRPAPTTTGL
jgi:VIT1/CCC1 family predicted Fe2+/Mn2+ transporter